MTDAHLRPMQIAKLSQRFNLATSIFACTGKDYIMEDVNRVGSSSRTGMAGRAPTEKAWVTGLFTDRERAEQGFQALRTRGYDPKDINVVRTDDTRKKYFVSGEQTELGSKAAKGAGVGGAIGGTVGAIAAAIATVGTSVAIPGLGLVIAGPLAAALAGAGAGGVTGGLVGALIGAGIPE